MYDETPISYLSHKEKYESAVRKVVLVLKKIKELQAQGRAGVDIYMYVKLVIHDLNEFIHLQGFTWRNIRISSISRIKSNYCSFCDVSSSFVSCVFILKLLNN